MSDQHVEEEVHLKLDGTPPCPQCGGVALLLAQFPSAWRNNRGEAVPGLKEALLCPACDHGEPAAAELLALFAVDDQISPENLEVFSSLAAAWIESVRHRTVDEERLESELESWRRGEL
ncbi:DUF6300 family protein [Streptomyces sp. NPDC086776]|uniref:DUF6300 family protein n=1 Tax=Streptomyces sp. NPDC086776 TaxID=3365756 RepID=UPI0037F354FB